MITIRFFLLVSTLLIPQLARAEDGMDECRNKAAEITIGMTRADVDRIVEPDGGLNTLFKQERHYFVPQLKLGNKPVCMVKIDFSPDVASLGNRADSSDIVTGVSPPYMDYMHTD